MNLYIYFSIDNVDPYNAWLALRDAGVLMPDHLDFASQTVQLNLETIIQEPNYRSTLLLTNVQGIEAVGDPLPEENLAEIYENFNSDDLPLGLAKFIKTEKPNITDPYQLVEGPVYRLIDNAFYETWDIRKMSAEEKQAKITQVMSVMPEDYDPLNIETHKIFNEDTCQWEPTEDALMVKTMRINNLL
jgi:hypothetical protein